MQGNRAGFLLIGGILITTTVMGFYFRYKFAGLTGDTYGAINELSEIIVLLVALIIVKVGPGLIG